MKTAFLLACLLALGASSCTDTVPPLPPRPALADPGQRMTTFDWWGCADFEAKEPTE